MSKQEEIAASWNSSYGGSAWNGSRFWTYVVPLFGVAILTYTAYRMFF